MESYLLILKDVRVLFFFAPRGKSAKDTDQSGEGIVSEVVSTKISFHFSLLLFTSVF